MPKPPRQCWARLLGDCKGPLTREHIVSSCLIGAFVRVEGLIDGPPKTIGKSGFVVNALCRGHNNRLSECDQAAKEMSEAADWMFADSTPRDSADLVIEVNGHRFARWMAKTACNQAAVEGLDAPEPWVRFAFSPKDNRSIGVYFVRTTGDKRPFPAAHYKWTWTASTDTEFGIAACFYFNGLMAVLSTEPTVESKSGVNRYFREIIGVQEPDILARPPGVKIWEGPVLRGAIRIVW